MTTQDAQLPGDREAEAQVIGGCLLDPAKQVPVLAKIMRRGDCTDPAHEATARVLVDMHRRGEPIDVATVRHRLDALPEFQGTGSAAYLADVAVRCVTAAHVEHHAKIVADAALKRRIALASADIQRAALNGHAGAELLADWGATLEDLRKDRRETSRFKALTAAELDAADLSTTWLVDWLLVEGQPCIWAGAKKCLKTTTLVDLGISIATGGDFLGKFRVSHARSFLLCSGESGGATLRETSRRVASSKGWAFADVPNFQISEQLPRLSSISDLAAWESFVADRGAEVVAVDPAYLCMPGDDMNNLFKTGELLASVMDVCNRLGVTLILAHHTKKNRGPDLAAFDAPELGDLAWSGFAEFARQWVLLGRRERYVAGTGEHRLWLNYGGSAGHGGCNALTINEGVISDAGGRYYDVKLAKASEARDDAEQRRAEAKAKRQADQVSGDHKAIVDVLARLPEQCGTKTAIRDALGMNSGRFTPALAAAIKAGDVTPTTVTKANGQTYEGFKLADPDSPGLTQ